MDDLDVCSGVSRIFVIFVLFAMWAFSLALLIKLNLVRKDTFTLDTAELLFFLLVVRLR